MPLTTEEKRDWLEEHGTFSYDANGIFIRWHPYYEWANPDEVYATSYTDDVNEAAGILYDDVREALWDALRETV